MYQLSHVPQELLKRAESFPVNALCYCSKYKWQLHVSATK